MPGVFKKIKNKIIPPKVPKVKTRKKYPVTNMTKYYPEKDPKKEAKRLEFLRQGGGLSGVYDISKPGTKQFVREYKDYIPRSEIYKRDRKGNLNPVYKKHR